MHRLLLLLLFFTTTYTKPLSATPGQVLIMRHAEKPDTGDSLSKQGFERAKALTSYMTADPLPFQMIEPAAVYAQCSSKNHASTRPVQTVSALANIWTVPFYVRYTAGDYKDMVTEIMNMTAFNDKMVLICWEHDNIPYIAECFGVKNPPTWSEDDYDHIWVLSFSGGSLMTFTIVAEELMYGDASS